MSDPTAPKTGEPTEQQEPCTGPPSRDEVRQTMRPRFRHLGLPMLEFWATWWFWHWRNTMAFRWLCEAVIVVAVFAGIAGLYWDIEARQEERQEWVKGRAVDHAQLFAQIAALAKDVQFKDPKNPTDIERAIAEKAGAGIGPIMFLLAREDVSMWQLNVAGVRFPRSLNLNNADLFDADLSNAELFDADLSNADLRWANLRDADLSNADLSGANLSSARLWNTNLSIADLRDTDLSNAHLIGADLSFANLTFANLSRANLSDANLIGANLRRADLEGAQLYKADLEGAQLQGANLTYANLSGAKLRRVRNLTQEQLDRACIWEGYEPPNLDEAKDPETEKPLVWRGKTCPE